MLLLLAQVAGRIFLNYRREDEPGWVRAFYGELLIQAFSPDQVFMDVEGRIPFGTDFVDYLCAQVEQCDVLLVFIGPTWLASIEQRMDEHDFVRIEIEAAFSQGKTVVPVLVGGAKMPKEAQLPESMRKLCRLNAADLRSGRFSGDSRTLISWLKGHLESLSEAKKVIEPKLDVPAPKEDKPQLVVPDISWAANSGRDKYGLWADADICGVVARMRWIKSGTFLMGSPDSDKEAFGDEKPQHQVTLTQGFWMGQIPCTQKFWQTVMGSNPSYFKGWFKSNANYPVESVSWHDVQEFLQVANSKSLGLDLKLPTEAQFGICL